MKPDVTESMDPGMRGVLAAALEIAASKRPLLLAGEAGCGRSTLARYLHHRIAPESPFVSLDSEDVEGLAFWDDESNATVFFGEIGRLRKDLQQALGDRLRTAEPSIRLIASTSHEAARALSQGGSIVADLLEAFGPNRLSVPPLRERPGDIPALVETFLSRESSGAGLRVADAALGYLVHYDWPGNVRELEQLTRRFRKRAIGQQVTVDDLPPQIRWFPGTAVGCIAQSKGEIGFNPLAEEFQYQLIAAALRRTRQR